MTKPAKKNNPSATNAKAARPAVSNQVTLDANNPIPFEYGGSAFSYISNFRYIPFLHPFDTFFQTLLEAKLLSSTHTACINTKKTYCAGAGLYDRDGKEFSTSIVDFLGRLNDDDQSDTELSALAFESLFTFGNVPVEVVRFTVGKKRFLNVHVHNVMDWRLGWPDENGKITSAIQTRLFRRQGIITSNDLKTARVLPLYDPSKPNLQRNWKTDEKGVERTLIWLRNKVVGYDHYGMPSSVSSLVYQVMEYKGARYNLDNFENNMVMGGLLALRGNLSTPEADRIARAIIKTHTGDGKRGRVAVVASEAGIEKSDFHQYDTQAEGSFLKFDESMVHKIILANEWDALLAGIIHGSSLGKGNTFLRTMYQIKKTTVIDPAQAFMVKNLWRVIQQIAVDWNLPEFRGFKLGLKDIDPISILADVDPTPAVRVNEVREALGLPNDDTQMGERYLGELRAQQNQQGGANVSA